MIHLVLLVVVIKLVTTIVMFIIIGSVATVWEENSSVLSDLIAFSIFWYLDGVCLLLY